MVQLPCLMHKAWDLTIALHLLHIYHWEWTGKWAFSICQGWYIYLSDLPFGKAYYDLICCFVIYAAVMPIVSRCIKKRTKPCSQSISCSSSRMNTYRNWRPDTATTWSSHWMLGYCLPNNDRWRSSCYWAFRVRRKSGVGPPPDNGTIGSNPTLSNQGSEPPFR